jgi:phosphonate transport system substrate-binding protein
MVKPLLAASRVMLHTLSGVRVLLLVCAAAMSGLGARAEKPAELFRLGFSLSMLAGTNENDARASIRAIAAAVSNERNIRANPEPLLFKGTDEITRSLESREVDAVSMTMDEYWALGGELKFSRLLLAGQGMDPREEYVMLVRGDSGWASLADLRGKRLSLHDVPRMRLGYVWLDVLLARAGQPPVNQYFRSPFKSAKLSKIVLDVFFKTADACLVTRHGFTAMTELNPQVGRQLKVLAVSPPMAPAFFAFRTEMPQDYVDRIMGEFKGVQRTPAGRQALTIFQVGDLSEHSPAVLDGALGILDEYRRLRPEAANRLIARLRQSAAGPMQEDVP